MTRMHSTSSVIASLTTLSLTAPLLADDYSALSFRKKITINTTASGIPTTTNELNFPFLVRLNASNFHFSSAMIDGSDIRFSKINSTPLSFEIESYDAAAQKAAIWVRLDTVYAGNSSQGFMIYSGNASATSASNSSDVFRTQDSACFVLHLSEPQAATTGTFPDATTHQINGADTGISSIDREGVIGSGLGFNGSTSRMKVDGPLFADNWVPTKFSIGFGAKFRSYSYPSFRVCASDPSWFFTTDTRPGAYA